MTEEILQSILVELKTQREEGQNRQLVLTQISTALLGIPNTENKGLVGDFKDHVAQDLLLTNRISRAEKGLIALFTGGAGTGTVVGLWDHIKGFF